MRIELQIEGRDFVPGDPIFGRVKIHVDERFSGDIRVVPEWEIGQYILEKNPQWGGSLLFSGVLVSGYYEYEFEGVAPPGPFTTNGKFVDIKTRIRAEAVSSNSIIAHNAVGYVLLPGPVNGPPKHYDLEDDLELEVRANTPVPNLRIDLPESFPPEVASTFRVNYVPDRDRQVTSASIFFEGTERYLVSRTSPSFQLHHGFRTEIPLQLSAEIRGGYPYQIVTTFTPPKVCSYHGVFNQIVWRIRVVIQGPEWVVNEVFPIVVHPRMRPEVEF